MTEQQTDLPTLEENKAGYLHEIRTVSETLRRIADLVNVFSDFLDTGDLAIIDYKDESLEIINTHVVSSRKIKPFNKYLSDEWMITFQGNFNHQMITKIASNVGTFLLVLDVLEHPVELKHAFLDLVRKAILASLDFSLSEADAMKDMVKLSEFVVKYLAEYCQVPDEEMAEETEQDKERETSEELKDESTAD